MGRHLLPSACIAILLLGVAARGDNTQFRDNEEMDAGGMDASPDFVQGDASQIPPRPNSPMGGMKMSVPKLTPEEEHSTNLPAGMACDACQAVVYQLVEKLKERESKQTSKERGKPLRESQYLEVLESVCSSDWSGYGVKDIDGKHMLSGPGLSAEGHMSMMYGGGQWPTRLNKKCGQIMEDMGEDELYQAYYSMKQKPSGINPELFCKTILTDCKKRNVEADKKKAKKMKNTTKKAKKTKEEL